MAEWAGRPLELRLAGLRGGGPVAELSGGEDGEQECDEPGCCRDCVEAVGEGNCGGMEQIARCGLRELGTRVRRAGERAGGGVFLSGREGRRERVAEVGAVD